jgi:TonB family protein
MSVLLYRRRRSSWKELLPFAGGAVVVLLLLALLFSNLIVKTEHRYLRMRVGDARILERELEVHDLSVVRPEVASVEVDPRQGLVVSAHKRGLAEVTFDRADGKRFHWFVEVRDGQPIRMTLSPARRRTRVARKDPEPRRLRREERKKEPLQLPEAKPKGQVVEIDKPAVEERPADAKYLSEYDSKVREETRARERHRQRAPAATPQQPAAAERAARAPPSRTGPAQPRLTRAPGKRLASAQELGPPEVPKVERGAEEPPEERREEPGLLRPEQPGGPGRIDINPRPEVIARALGGGAFPDHLKGVREGERTFLNTKSWKGASFFNRVKRAVAQHWNPGEVYRRRDPYGNIYGIKDRYTLLHITLNANGSLRNLRVITPSGIDFLDEEAVGAVEAAQPFPNPPAEVRDKDGLIRFGFGFYFEISDRPLFRIYRYE